MITIDQYITYPPGAGGHFLASLIYPDVFVKVSNSNEYITNHASSIRYYSAMEYNEYADRCSVQNIDRDKNILNNEKFLPDQDYKLGISHFFPLHLFENNNIQIGKVIAISFNDQFMLHELLRIKSSIDNKLTHRNISNLFRNIDPVIMEKICSDVATYYSCVNVRKSAGYFPMLDDMMEDFKFFEFCLINDYKPNIDSYQQYVIKNYYESSNIMRNYDTMRSDYSKIKEYTDNCVVLNYEELFFDGIGLEHFGNKIEELALYSMTNINMLLDYYKSVFNINEDIKSKLLSYKERIEQL